MKFINFLANNKSVLILPLALSFGLITGCNNNSSESNKSATDTTVQVTPSVNDPLPSWNEGDAKQAIIKFVHVTTDSTDSAYVKPGERIATFDQDGTLWVEHPVYSQLIYCLDRVPELVKAKPALKNVEPFKTVMTGNMEAIGKLSMPDLEKIAVATLTGMTEAEFKVQVKDWVSKAKDHRWNKLYIDLTYQPMKEVMSYLRDNGYKTYIVTGGGQDFVRAYSDQVYGVPAEQVIGTAVSTTFKYDSATGKSALLKNPKLLLNDNGPGPRRGFPPFGPTFFGAAAGMFALMTTLMRVLVLCLLSSIVLFVGREYVERVGARAAAEPLKAGAIGLLAQLLFGPLLVLTIVVFVVTIVGIPLLLLVPFALLAFGGVLLIGFTAVAYHLGRLANARLSWHHDNTYLTGVTGIMMLVSPVLIARLLGLADWLLFPLTGTLVFLGLVAEYLAWTVGFGAVALLKFERAPAAPPAVSV